MRAWLLVAVVAIVGCSGGESPGSGTPAEPPVREFQQCGSEVNRHGNGYDAQARDCFWQAVQTGKPVAFTTISYSEEGDPITYTVQALAASHGPGPRFTVVVDSKDRLGKQGTFSYTCRSIGQVSYQQGAYTDAPKRHGFVLSGCGGDEAEIAVP